MTDLARQSRLGYPVKVTGKAGSRLEGGVDADSAADVDEGAQAT